MCGPAKEKTLYRAYFFFTVSEDRFRTPPFFCLLRCEGKDRALKGGIQKPRHANRHKEKEKLGLYWSSLCLSITVLFPSPGDSFPQWQLYDVSCSLEIPIEYVKNKFCFFFFLFHCALLSRMMSSDTMPLHPGYSTLICLSVQCIHPYILPPCQPPSGLLGYQFDCCMLLVFKPLLFYLTAPKHQSMDADVVALTMRL